MRTQSIFVSLLLTLFGISACAPASTPAGVEPSATGAGATLTAPTGTTSPIPTEAAMSFQLTSTAFTQGNAIPPIYTCSGKNISPPLAWSNPPAGTQSFALILDDPDAPGGTFTHWVLYNLPAAAGGLEENIPASPQLSDGSLQGRNSAGGSGYTGPCPPSGTHRYFFKLYALDSALSLPAGAGAAQLQQAMQGHILGNIELMGTYKKP